MKRTQGLLFALTMAVAGATIAGGVAMAQDPAAVIAARQAELKKAGDATKALGGYAKGGDLTADEVKAHAATIAAVAQAIPGWWPAGTAKGVGKSDALPAIWDKPDEFKARIAAFQTESAKLVEAAAGGDRAAITAQFGKTAGTCKACHEGFRD